MANVTANTTSCNLTDYWISFELTARFLSNNVILPLYFIFGTSGRAISLLSVCLETKVEGAYLYQIFVICSECFEIFTFSAFVSTTYLWSGLAGQRALLFQKCYACMWYTIYLANFLQNAFASLTLTLTLSMTSDRILCLWKPIYYKKMKHRRVQCICLIVCIFCSCFTSWFYTCIFEITDQGDGIYGFRVSPNFRSPIGYYFLHLQSAFRMALAASLILSNIILVCVHRKRMEERAAILFHSAEDIDTHERHKSLFRMTMCQSIFNTIGVLSGVSYHAAEYIVPNFYLCWANAMAPFVDGILEIADILEFYSMLIICKKFREMVVNTLRRMTCTNSKNTRVELARIRVRSHPNGIL